MERPLDGEPRPVMFYAGDDVGAKRAVAEIIEDVGFEAIDAGPLTRARELEEWAVLWIALAMGGMGRDFAFAVKRRR